jgi:hypothetical protein
VYMVIFWIYLPHMKENMPPFTFWAWLTSLNMICPLIESIYLQTAGFHASLWLHKTSLCVYTYIYIWIYVYICIYMHCVYVYCIFFFIFAAIFFYCCAELVYTVAFTKVLTM